MSNIENELRRMGDNLRNQGSGRDPLPPRQRRRIKVRRALFAAGGAITAIALVGTASYGVTLVQDHRDNAPAEDRRGGSNRVTLYSHLGARATAVIELYAAEGTICYSLASIDGYGTFSRVAIVEGLDAREEVAPGPDAENSGVARGSAECVHDVEPSTIDSITAAPERHFLLLEDPVRGERVSSLQYPPKVDAPPCDELLTFEPTYLPQGWASDLQPGPGGGEGGDAVGHFGNAAEPGTAAKAAAGFADLFTGIGHFAQSDTIEIEVLGSPAQLGDIHDGYSVEFSHGGCRYTLAGYGIDRNELRRFATGLRPEDESSTLIRFDRSGGFTGDHHVLTIKRDGSALLESPGSRGLVEPVEFEIRPDAMATVRDQIRQIDWPRLDERRTLTNVMVADGYLIEMSHDGYNVIIEAGAEPRSLRALIGLLNGIIDARLSDVLAADPSLSLSEATVRPGDVVELSIRARDSDIWGLLTSLEAQQEGRWRRVAYWRTWPGNGPRVLEAISTGGGTIEDIGFSGSAEFKLKIPQLGRGIYRITKEFISEGTAPVEERTTTAEVRFEVVN